MIAQAFRFALRDLRGGLAGLRLLGICLFLGVAALAAVGSLSSAIVGELSAQGREILGGDLQLGTVQRVAEPAERAALARLGRLSETIRMRAMASIPANDAAGSETSQLVELKGVDDAYPLYGKLRMEPGALANRPGAGDVAIAPALAERLALKPGGRVRIGEANFRVTGIIAEEPDRLGEGFTLGPVALVSRAGLEATKLVQPGSLYSTKYRIKTAGDPAMIGKAFVRRFKSGGWQLLDRSNGAPGTRRFVERLGQFLALVGLTALIVAGIGVGNGVTSYLDGKRSAIATLKALGATSPLIFVTYLVQIVLVASVAIVAGLAIGALSPWLVGVFAGDTLPVKPGVAIYGVPLLTSAAFGLLIAVGFAIEPLARARAVTAASLFRGGLDPQSRTPLWVRGGQAIAALLIAVLAILTAREPWFAVWFLVGAAALLAGLSALGAVVSAIAARLPRPASPLARLALANLHRPGAQTTRLVVALGLGLTLFTSLAVIESNLAGQIERNVPKRAPNLFVLDIPVSDGAAFQSLVAAQSRTAQTEMVPSLRGPIVAVNTVRVADMKAIPESAWILRGDRGLTYAVNAPVGNRITAGKWWPRDYAGPPLISLDRDAAEALDIGVGDTLTVAVLGVEVTAKIASLREINWDSMGFNFAIIFSPGVLEGAPHTYMATIAMPGARETSVSNAITQTFPSASLIKVKDVIAQVSALLGQLAMAVRAASLVAVAAGIAVLIGAVAAARQARVYDAVILKTLGATRRQILGSQAIEYGGLALIVSAIAMLIGCVGGWYAVTQLLDLPWAPDWIQIIATTVIGAITVLGLGLAGSLPALAARPALALRSL